MTEFLKYNKKEGVLSILLFNYRLSSAEGP